MVICAHLKEIGKQVLLNLAKPDSKFLLAVKSGFANFCKGGFQSSYILFVNFCKFGSAEFC